MELMLVTKQGTLCRQKIANISIQKRTSQGVRLVKLDSDDEVVAIDKMVVDDQVDEIETALADLLPAPQPPLLPEIDA